MQAYATPATGPATHLRLIDGPPSGVPAPPAAARTDVIDQLLGQLAELVADRVAQRLARPQQHRTDEWLDSRRAAEYLGIGRDSLRRLAAQGSIPTEQAGVGCKLFFRRSDLDVWRCNATGPIESLRSQAHG
jgi:excisionase family DNA binding protein